jgi:ParB family chromosome partitioning protein
LKKGLGRGLDAIFTSSDNKSIDLKEVVEIRINDIEPNTYQPRKIFDDDKISELALSIKEHGIIQPIIVSKKGNFYTIIAGERRWRAAREAGLKTVPAIVRSGEEKENAELSLIENIQREDLNPIEEAEAIKLLMEKYKMTQEIVAETIGKSRSAVANMLRLLTLDERVKEMVYKNIISEGHARAIASIAEKEKQYKIACEIHDKSLNVRNIEDLIKNEKINKTKKRRNTLDVIFKDIEERLTKFFGSKVKLTPKKNKGKIVINYSSNEELERILEIVEKNT